MEDVIFSGSESTTAMSMAEVSLTLRLEENDSVVPQYAGLSEITVTRRLFRDGESEYLINKTLCRLLDITDLFLGTGVGTRAYSIVEQGRVGLIVSAKPEDRRAFIEEAAGVTKYKARRKVAERKMEYTQQNLLRVSDVISELDKQLDSLARQAKKADRYKKIKQQLREIELHAASHRFLELRATAKVLQERIAALGTEERASFDAVRKLEDDIARDRTSLEAEGESLQLLQQQCHDLESQVQLADQRLSHWKEDREKLQQRVESEQGELAALAERTGELVKLLGAREAEESLQISRCQEGETAVAVAQEELRRLTRLQSELLERQGRERNALMEIAARLANRENDAANLSRRRAETRSEQSTIASERDGLREQERALEAMGKELAQRVSERRLAATELTQRCGVEEMGLDEARREFAENEVKVISLREELADKRARLASLEQIQRNYEGFDRGVRAVMLQAGAEAGSAGVYGLVSDVLSVPDHLEKAIEAALGDRLQSVIVENGDKAVELIEHLKATAEGRSTFLPLRPDGGSAAPQPDFSQTGVLAVAAEHARCDERFAPLVRSLLEGVVVVTDLSAARRYADKTGHRFTLVTLEGEVLRPDGAITGGALEGPAIGALQKKREIAELAGEIAVREEEYKDFLTRHYALQKRMQRSEGVLKGLAKSQQAEEIGLAAEEKDLQRVADDLARIRQNGAAAEQRLAQADQALKAIALDEEQSRGELAELQLTRAGKEELLQQLDEELDTLSRRAQGASDELTALRVAAAADAERAQAASKESLQLRQQLSELDARRERLEVSTREALAKSEELAAWMKDAADERSDRASRLGSLQEQLTERRRAHGELAARVRADDARLRELRGRLDELTQGLSQLSIEERELAIELEHLIDQVRDRHQLELSHELHRFHLEALPENHAARVGELRAQIERLGEINLTAGEEHTEVAGRCAFLREQQKDLEASIQQLRQAIVRIDRTSRERFKRAFEMVNEKFQLVFPRLFGGGRAALILTEAEPGGEPGVEIVAQPPGKKLQNVNLLSGGEKALTAVSLLFGIFLTKPTPFCILDEVDAPLDEANVGRYNEMVREISKQCQFILITHNKRTMEALDTLYGVTMQEPGISKLVSVKLRDAVAANEDRAA
jgi:chromosome segregation protein